MQTIKDTFEASLEVKKSIFLAFLTPIENFEKLKVELWSKNQKAAHIVWAYRYLNEFDQIVENSSDDGEPKGTSGPPSLNVLKGNELINIAVLIVRYFGGIKLGTGGLVRAYSQSVNEVIKASFFVEYEKLFNVSFYVPFCHFSKVEHFLNTNEFLNIEKNFDANGVEINLKIPQEKIKILEIFLEQFINIKLCLLE